MSDIVKGAPPPLEPVAGPPPPKSPLAMLLRAANAAPGEWFSSQFAKNTARAYASFVRHLDFEAEHRAGRLYVRRKVSP